MGTYLGKSEATKELLLLLHAGREHQIPVIIKGPPGIGKTEIVKTIAKQAKLPLYVLLLSTMDPTDVAGLPTIKQVKIVDPETGVERVYTTTEPALNYWAMELLEKGEGILFFDEASNAAPAVQAVALSLLQGRTLGAITLPDKVWMILAANGEDTAADGWTLTPPMSNRLLHIDYLPDVNDWIAGMMCNWGETVAEQKTPHDVKKFLALTESRTRVAGFMEQHPDFLLQVPTDPVEAGEPWPSPRSWDAVAKTLSSLPRTPDALNLRIKALQGLVGKKAKDAYIAYERNLRLPDYHKVLDNPAGVPWAGLSTAEQKLTLDMVIGRLTGETAHQSIKVIKAFKDATNRTDLVATVVDDVSEKVKRLGLTGDPEILALIQELYRTSNVAFKEAGLNVKPVQPQRAPLPPMPKIG